VSDVEKEPGRFRRALTRLTADEEQLDRQGLKADVASAGATHVSDCAIGSPVCVAGALRAVVLRPRAGVPTLEAELYDGTGTVTLIWLGRRRIRGVDPGRNVVVHGRLTKQDGRPTIYNPAYELRASGA
jgi:hypothetical protein